MNKTYQENSRIKELIKKICEVSSPFGETDKTAVLKNQLEAIAEVSFIQGQMCVRREVLKDIYKEKSLEQVNEERRVIDNFAHDYKGMSMEYESLRLMLNRLIAAYDACKNIPVKY